MKGLIIFEDGIEDNEGISSRALLRRAAVEVDTVTTNYNKIIRTGYGIKVLVDYHIDEINLEDYDFLIIPGGPYIASIYDKETKISEIVTHFHENQKLIGAICAAPRLIGHMGLLDGSEFTCYPGCEDDVKGGKYRPDLNVVKVGKIITARSSGRVIEFIDEIVRTLFGNKKADSFLEHLVWKK